MNNWCITARLGQEPRLNTLPSGDPVLNLHAAIPNQVKRGDQWKDEPIWVDITVFGNRCQWLHDNLRTGTLIEASGRMSLREFEGSDGKRHTRIELIAKECNALANFGDKNEHRQREGDRQQRQQPSGQRGGMRNHGTRPGTSAHQPAQGGYPYNPDDDIAF